MNTPIFLFDILSMFLLTCRGKVCSVLSRKKHIKVYAINIKTQPKHNPNMYRELLLHAYSEGLEGKMRGQEKLMLSVANYRDEMTILTGLICCFTNINEKARWFDTEAIAPVSPEKIPEIPVNIKPNFSEHRFIFDLDAHMMILSTDRSPNSFASGLRDLFDNEQVEDNFGSVDIEVVKSTDAIEKIISLNDKYSLEIKITIPNSDGLEEADQAFMQRLQDKGAGRYDVKQVAMHNKSLELDKEDRVLLNLSRLNGQATATGSDGEKRITVSTTDYPFKESLFYDPEQIDETTALFNILDSIKNKIAGGKSNAINNQRKNM